MVNKTLDTAGAAVEGTLDGAVMKLGGFGLAGQASELIDALIAQSARSLTFVNNNAGSGKTGLASLFKKNQVRKIGGRYTPQTDSPMFGALDHSGVQTLSLFHKVVWLNAFALLTRVLVAFPPHRLWGGLHVLAQSDLANRHTGALDASPAVGGAMGLALDAKREFIMTAHCTQEGVSKPVLHGTYPSTALACVSRIHTDLAVRGVTPLELAAIDCMPGRSHSVLEKSLNYI